ncbi:MAG: transcription-repair coupling factor, partial [Pseudomonadota bacterium]
MTQSVRPLEAGEVKVGGAPEGYDALLLADLVARAQAPVSERGPEDDRFAHRGPVLHIARDDQRAAALGEALSVIAPEIPILRFPAWDCLPYDRVSPNPAIVSDRMATLATLAEDPRLPCLVIATVNAALQRVPPLRTVYGESWVGAVGARCDTEELLAYLGRNGYRRASTVAEPGDFAIRGGVIDIYPPGAGDPVRLDLFGDTLESARRFDAESQRTVEKIDRVELAPISEAMLTDEAVQRFRRCYRETFGASGAQDPLYAAVSDGARFQGMEHWLPFFHDRLDTLFDYLPRALVTVDHQVDDAVVKRWETIADHHRHRVEALEESEASRGLRAGQVYKPIDPEMLYLPAEELTTRLAGRAIRRFSPHQSPPGPGVIDAGGRMGRDFIEERRSEEARLFQNLADHLNALRSAGKTVALASFSEGARDRLATVLADHGVAGLAMTDRWRE